mgnify:FL=1
MKFVTRQEWGATAPKKPWTWITPSRIEGIVIHHSGVEGGPTGKDAVRAFERHHMNTRGWSSIAYNWLVNVDGTVYEGRAQGAVGGATKGWNFKTEAISYIGYGFEPLTLEAQQGIKQVIDYLQHKYRNSLWIKGHRDLANTSCPGDWLYDWVMAGAKEVAAAGGVTQDDTKPVDWEELIRYLRNVGKGLANKPLKRGSRGKNVLAVQDALKKRDIDPGPIDGIFGFKTKKAVQKFQLNQGFLKPNGRVDERTWDALLFR